MTEHELATVERPDHPAARLAAAFGRWAETPAGDRTVRMTIDVVDSVNVRVRPMGAVVELTDRQVGRMAAALAGSVDGMVTDSAESMTYWMRDWTPYPGEQPGATVIFTDRRITDDHLDWNEPPEPVRVPIGADRIDPLAVMLRDAVDLLMLTRTAFLHQARWQEGQRLRVGTTAAADPSRRKTFSDTGRTCVVSEVHVHLPRDDSGKPTFSYVVRIDNEQRKRLLWLEEDQLEPID